MSSHSVSLTKAQLRAIGEVAEKLGTSNTARLETTNLHQGTTIALVLRVGAGRDSKTWLVNAAGKVVEL